MMPTKQDQAAVSAALEETLRCLPLEIRSRIQPFFARIANGQPDLIDQPENRVQHYRVRLLPRSGHRTPHSFWNSTWCFYEIGAGSYPTTATSQVQFFMAGNNSACGSGAYNTRVADILAVAARKRKDLINKPIGINSYAHLIKYGTTPSPDPAEMGCDMAWIIQETFDSFLKISAA